MGEVGQDRFEALAMQGDERDHGRRSRVPNPSLEQSTFRKLKLNLLCSADSANSANTLSSSHQKRGVKTWSS